MSQFAAIRSPQAAALVAVLTCVAFLNAFGGVFVYDDVTEIHNNPAMERLVPPWKAMFVGNQLPARPLPYLTFAIDHAVWGKNPFGYHVLNLVIHVIAAIAVFHLARLTLLSPRLHGRYAKTAVPLATVIAMMWAVHPLQTQAVTYIYQRIESMTGMFLLVSLASFAQAAASGWDRRWLAGSVVASAAAMASKENAVVIPVLVLLYDWLFVAGQQPTLRGGLRDLWSRRTYYAALCATWVVLGLQLGLQGGNYQEFTKTNHPPLEYALTQPGVLLRYLRLVVWPVGQRLDYSTWPVAKSLAEVWPAALVIGVLLVMTAVGVVLRRTWSWLGVLFFVTLAPTSSILPIEAVANEHRMYVALAAVVGGIVLAVAAAGEWAAGRRFGWAPRDGRMAAVAAGVIVLLLTTATQFRNQVYRQASDIWLDVYRKDPRNFRANWMMAGIFDKAGETDIAIEFAERAVKARPDCRVFCELGRHHVTLGDQQGAERLCRRALEIQTEVLPPDDEAVLASRGDLAIALRLQRRYDEADAICRDAIDSMVRVLGESNLTTLSSHLIMAETLSRNGDHAAAGQLASRTLETAEAKYGDAAEVTQNAAIVLSMVLLDSGKPAAAGQVARRFLAAAKQAGPAAPSIPRLTALLDRINTADQNERRGAGTAVRPAPNGLLPGLPATSPQP